MKALEWTIDRWLMQGLLTSILTGVGFLVISFTIEYVKRFRRGRQAKEQEIFLQRILCGEQVLEWSNGTVRARGRKDCLLGHGRSMPRGHVLFEQYKRAGGFLGVGLGYYSRMAEARRRATETLQDRSTTAVVSRASWCGGPGTRAIVGASSTSVDDELTSLDWDSCVTTAPPVPSYLSPTGTSVKSDADSRMNSGSNANNVAAAATAVKTSNASSCTKRNNSSGLRLWSTQHQRGNSVEEEEEERDTASDLGADLCARALREHPHLAPFLRRDVLEAARAVEKEEAAKGAKRVGRNRFKRSLEKGAGRSEESPSKTTRERSLDPGAKRSGSTEKPWHKEVSKLKSGTGESREKQSKTLAGAKLCVKEAKHTEQGKGKRLLKHTRKANSEKSLDQLKEQKEVLAAEKKTNPSKIELIKREGSNSANEGEPKGKGKLTTKPERNHIIKRETSKCSKRESSSTSVRSLPSRRRSETSQPSPRRNSTRSELTVCGSNSQVVGVSRRPRQPRGESAGSRVGAKRFASRKEGVKKEEGETSNLLTWPGGTAESATTIAHEVRYGVIVKRQDTTHSEVQENSISSSVDYQYTSYEEKIGMTYQFAGNKQEAFTASGHAFPGSNFEEENKDVISSSISGYIRKLVFGESHGPQEEQGVSGPRKFSDATSFTDHGKILMPNSPMTTIEESPFASGSKTVSDENTVLCDSENAKFSQENRANNEHYESCADDEMRTDSEADGLTNTTARVPADFSSFVEGVSCTLASKSETDKNLTSTPKPDAQNDSSADLEAQCEAGKRKKKTRKQGRRQVNNSRTSSTNAPGKSKGKKNSSSSPPVLLTSVRSRASSFSGHPRTRDNHPNLKRSISNQGQSPGTNKTILTTKPSPKKSFKRREASHSGLTTIRRIQCTTSNAEDDSKKDSAGDTMSASKQKSSESEKTRSTESKQSLKMSSGPSVPQETKKENGTDSSTRPGNSTGSAEKTCELQAEDVDNKVSTVEGNVVKLTKAPALRKVRKAKGSFAKVKSSAKISPKHVLYDQKTKPPDRGTQVLDDEKSKSRRSNFEFPDVAKKKGEKKADLTSLSSSNHLVKSKTKEEERALKSARDKNKSRHAAASMLDNYEIEVKRKEVLGSVVSLVTYHPKNNAEINQKALRDTIPANIDQSENCKYELNNDPLQQKRIEETVHRERKTGECSCDPHSNQLATDSVIPQSVNISPASYIEERKENEIAPIHTDSSEESSLKDVKPKSAPLCSSIEFDTDSESELTYTSKYGRYSLRLHDPDDSRKQVDKFKTIIDAAEENPSSSRPFALRPSTLDNVVGSFGTCLPPEVPKSIKPPLEDLSNQKPPVSPRSAKGLRSSEMSPSSHLAMKPVDSLALDLEMATTNALKQLRSSRTQSTSKVVTVDFNMPTSGKESQKSSGETPYNTRPKLDKMACDELTHLEQEQKVHKDLENWSLLSISAAEKDLQSTCASQERVEQDFVEKSFQDVTNLNVSSESKGSKTKTIALDVKKNCPVSTKQKSTSSTVPSSLKVKKTSKDSSNVNKVGVRSSGEEKRMAVVNSRHRDKDFLIAGINNRIETSSSNDHGLKMSKFSHVKHEKSPGQNKILTKPSTPEDSQTKLSRNLKPDSEKETQDHVIGFDTEKKGKNPNEAQVNNEDSEKRNISPERPEGLQGLNNKALPDSHAKQKVQSSILNRQTLNEKGNLKHEKIMNALLKNQRHGAIGKYNPGLEQKKDTHARWGHLTEGGVTHPGNDISENPEQREDRINITSVKASQNKRKSPTRRHKLCINRTSPIKLQELHNRNSKAVSLNPLKENNGTDQVHIEQNDSSTCLEINNLKRESDSHKESKGQSIFSMLHETHEGEECHQPIDQSQAVAQGESVTPIKSEKTEKHQVELQKLEFNQNNPVKLQKINISRKNSLVFRPPSSGSTNSLEMKRPAKGDEHGQVAVNPSAVTVVSSIRENSSHIFGSNASFSLTSFQAACTPESRALAPEVKVSNYRLAGDHFRTYRQRKSSDGDE